VREKLNEDPKAQVALVGILIVAVGFLLVTRMGGGGGGEEGSAPATEVAATVNGVTATGSTPGEAVEGAVESLEAGAATATASVAAPSPSMPVHPLPRPIATAYRSGATIVLLFVRDGGIDDRIVSHATDALRSLSGVYLHVVPAHKIAQYAAVTLGVDVTRVPALVVIRPKTVAKGPMEASVDYGYQTPKTVVQAVRDARYQGPESTYHPE
jgi:hypothetical protein